MTATDIRPVPVDVSSTARRWVPALTACLAGLLTLVVRLALDYHSFDVFGDEVIYTQLGRSVASGGFPRFDGRLFFFHGPVFFYLEAGWSDLTGAHAGLIAQIYQMRTLNAILAGATAVVLVLLATRVSSPGAGAAIGLLFAVGPFCIRQNARVLLGTGTMLWVLLGYLVLTSLIGKESSHRTRIGAVGAGLLFGVAVLTKDEAAMITVLPLLAAACLRWGPPRALTLLAAGTTVAAYAAYTAVVAVSGHFIQMWDAKTSGVQRLLGLIQTTGFNSHRAPSIFSRLIAESGYFGPTYLILVAAVPALILVVRRGGQLQRTLGLLYIAAALALGYALLLGTLEEQELYLLLIPSLIMLPAGAALLSVRRRAGKRRAAANSRRVTLTAVMTTALALALCLNVATGVQWRLQPDDGYAQLLRYMARHVPAGASITAFDGTDEPGITQYALAAAGYRVGRWVTPAARARAHVRYAVVPWTEIVQRYSYYSPARVRSIVSRGRVLFSFREPTYGDVTLYRLPPP